MIVDQWYARYRISMTGSSVAGIPPKLVAGSATIIQQETLQIRLNVSELSVQNTPKLNSLLVELNRSACGQKCSIQKSHQGCTGFTWTYNFSHSNEPVYQIPPDPDKVRGQRVTRHWLASQYLVVA